MKKDEIADAADLMLRYKKHIELADDMEEISGLERIDTDFHVDLDLDSFPMALLRKKDHRDILAILNAAVGRELSSCRQALEGMGVKFEDEP